MKITLGKKTPQQEANDASGGMPPPDMGMPPPGMIAGSGPQGIPQNEEISSINRRLKLMEERYNNLRGKVQLTDQNMLHKNKSFFSDIKEIRLELTEVKKEINEVKDKMMMLIKEIESFATKDSVNMLKKYIDMWNPIKFVTHNEVEEVVRETIDKIRRGQ